MHIKPLLLSMLTAAALPALADNEKIITALSPFGVSNMQISDSPIAGLKTVLSDQGIFYASEDGQYFLQGSLVQITPEGPVDLSNVVLIDKLNAMADKMIIYPAKEEKYVVNVFTDITCPYCMRLHEHMAEYNERGITVRYLAFPRAGAESKVADQMEAIWLAEDKQAALNEAKSKGGKSLLKPVKSKIAAEQFNIGVQFGVAGTPAIVLSNGTLVEGYRQPDELLSILESTIKAK